MFMRTPRSFVGHGTPLVRPRASAQLDYEGELAVESAPHGIRVNGIAPASVVEGSLQFPRERVATTIGQPGARSDFAWASCR